MSTSAQVDAPRLWIVLSRCYRALSQIAERSVRESGLGLSDFAALEALLHKGPLTITEIQSKVLLASGSMTAAIDRLEKSGLVTRNFTSADRRARLIELTPEGKRLIQASFKQHVRDLESATTPLNEEERRQLYLSIKKLGLHAEEVRDKGEKKKLVESL